MTQNLLDNDPPFSLPPEFPKRPRLPDFESGGEGGSLIYERRKLLLEIWENSLKSYYLKEKEGDTEGMKKILVYINDKFHDEDMEDTVVEEEFESGAPDSDISALLEELRKEQRSTLEESQRTKSKSINNILSSRRTDSNVTTPTRRNDSNITTPTRHSHLNATTPTSSTFNSTPTEEKPTTKTKPSSRMDILLDKWLGSTLYNTACTKTRRHYLFIPLQLLFLTNIIISTAVGSFVVGVVCGLGGGLGSSAVSGWVVWGYRKRSPHGLFVPGFYLAEGLAFVAGLCGVVGDGNLFFYCGIPGIILVIVATVLGRIGIISPLRGLRQDQDDSEIA